MTRQKSDARPGPAARKRGRPRKNPAPVAPVKDPAPALDASDGPSAAKPAAPDPTPGGNGEGPPDAPSVELYADAAPVTYKLGVGCPECGRVPAVRFAEREVLRARTDRRAANVQNCQCTRCRTIFWIRSGDIADAELDTAAAAAHVAT